MKQYPLSIENVGSDDYIVMSRGHHDIHEFMKAVRKDYDWPLSVPEHKWVKAVPDATGYFQMRYHYVEAGTRGAFPVTVAWEALGDIEYEFVFKEMLDVKSVCKTLGPTCKGCPDCGPVMGDATYQEMFGHQHDGV